MTNKKQ